MARVYKCRVCGKPAGDKTVGFNRKVCDPCYEDVQKFKEQFPTVFKEPSKKGIYR